MAGEEVFDPTRLPMIEIETDLDLIKLFRGSEHLEIHRTAGDPYTPTIEIHLEAEYRGA